MSIDQITVIRRKCGTIIVDIESSAGGYTLYAGQTFDGRVDLINLFGDIVHAWALPIRPGRDAVILPNGNLGYNGSHEKSAELYPAWDIWHGGHFMEVTPKGDIVWEYEDIYHHHDAQWLKNGNLLYTVAADMGEGHIGDIVKEVNRKGEIVWEWRAWEHLNRKEWPKHECFNDDHWPVICIETFVSLVNVREDMFPYTPFPNYFPFTIHFFYSVRNDWAYWRNKCFFRNCIK